MTIIRVVVGTERDGLWFWLWFWSGFRALSGSLFSGTVAGASGLLLRSELSFCNLSQLLGVGMPIGAGSRTIQRRGKVLQCLERENGDGREWL